MPRVTPQNRIPDILAAAVREFAKHGFRKALIDDIAKEAGVSPATLYNHFQNKAHLFHYAIENAALRPEDLPPPEASSTRSEKELVAFLTDYVDQLIRLPSVERLLKARPQPHEIDLAAELAEILGDLWQMIERHRAQLSMSQINSPLDEFPEVVEVFRNGLQAIYGQIERYLSKRIRDGVIRPLASVPAMARTMLEPISFFAWKQDLWGVTPRFAKEEAFPDLVAMIAQGLAATVQAASRARKVTVAARDRRGTAAAGTKPRARGTAAASTKPKAGARTRRRS